MKDLSGVLATLTTLFQSDRVFSLIAPALLVDPSAVKPRDSWSLSNRLIVLFSGAKDPRGFQQWKKVGRNVKKGAKAIYILVPSVKRGATTKAKEEAAEAAQQGVNPEAVKKILEEGTRSWVAGFLAGAVFDVKDTEGEPLPAYNPPAPPPLVEVASAWGIPVHYEATPDGKAAFYGCYSHGGEEKSITLLTHDTYTFLHELSHAAHDRVTGNKIGAVDPLAREIIAEFSAAALGRVLGLENEELENSALAYCRRYAAKSQHPGEILLRLLSEIEKVCTLILTTAAQEPAASSAA